MTLKLKPYKIMKDGYVMNNQTLHKKDIVYHTRILPTIGLYDLDELKIRTVMDTYFVGIEKHTKRAFLFPYSSIGKTIFLDRKDALKKVKESEKNKTIVSTETYYEEY